MKTKIISVLFLYMFSSAIAVSSVADENSMAFVNDREQEQLKLCFLYSNLLGYDISYINNPRLYKVTGEWLGVPYKYSGCTKNGIDCSGFVAEVFKSSYNKEIAGNAKDIFQQSQPLSKNELREGDFVFFRIRKKRISHVGIYLGDNKFVHASVKKGVMISDLSDPYYEKYFYKGGRIPL